MFQFLSAIVGFFLHPFVVTLTMMSLSGLLLYRRKLLPALGIVGFWVLLTSPLIHHLQLWQENRVAFPDKLPGAPATIVVLAGGTARLAHQSGPWQHLLYMGQSGRFWEALRLARQTPGMILVFSTGQPEWPEGDAMMALAQEFTRHDPPELKPAMHLMPAAMNTHDEALQTKAMVDQLNLPEHIVLVTSAWHMPRALATFKKLLPQVTPFPADYKIDRTKMTWSWSLRNLEQLSALLHEWIGALAYSLTGRT